MTLAEFLDFDELNDYAFDEGDATDTFPPMAFAVEGFFLKVIDKLSLQRYNDSKERTIVITILIGGVCYEQTNCISRLTGYH